MVVGLANLFSVPSGAEHKTIFHFQYKNSIWIKDNLRRLGVKLGRWIVQAYFRIKLPRFQIANPLQMEQSVIMIYVYTLKFLGEKCAQKN